MAVPNLKTENIIEEAHSQYDAGNFLVTADLCREILKIEGNNLEALKLFAAVLTKGGLNERAINVLEQTLLVGGPNSGVLYNYGVALRGAGHLIKASRAFRNAAKADPNWADCWFNLGETYRQLKNHSKAIVALQQAIRLENNNASYLFTLGNAFLDSNRVREAVKAYQTALKLSPDNIEYKNNLGVALRKVGKLEQAVLLFKEIIKQDSKYSAALNNLGLALTELERLSEAETAYLSALNNTPNYSDASLNLADLYQQLAAFEKAELCLKKAITQEKQNFHLLVNLGLVLQKQGRLEEAKEVLTKVPVQKDSNLHVSTALANVLRDLGEFDDALNILYNLSPKEPGYPKILANLALIYQHKGDLRKAEDLLRQAIEMDTHNISFHMNLAQVLLSRGKFQEGWEEFQWRQKETKLKHRLSNLPGKKWDGNNQFENSILVICEQGAGDCFQFVRFLHLLDNRFKDVTLSAPPSLYRLFKECFDSWEVVSQKDVPPNRDFHVLLMDLPYLLSSNDFSITSPYLKVKDELVKKWADRLPKNNSLKVGLCWQGNPKYETDYLRSIPFQYFIPLLDSGLAEFVAIQKGIQSAQLPDKCGLLNLGHEIDKYHGFLDTAAIMISLDLIITSDTATAHLAGALGRPVWLLLHSAPDWRWQLRHHDTPWYPTMRLFRQSTPRDWSGVISSVNNALKEF